MTIKQLFIEDPVRYIIEGAQPPSAHPSIGNDDWRDGLLIRVPNWLGDVIMTLPALTQLKKRLPAGKKLFVVCPANLEPLLSSLPIIDQIIPIPKAHKWWPLEERKRIRDLRAGIGVLFNNSLRDTFQLRQVGISTLYGAAARFRGPLLKGKIRFPKRKDNQLNMHHHASRYLSIAYMIGAEKWDGTLPEFAPQVDAEKVNELLSELSTPNDFLVLAPGAAYGDAKRWSADNFAAVARFVLEKGKSVVLVGSPAEKEVGDEILDSLESTNIVNLAGKTSLAELIQVLKKADICVANDSGVMHLAAAIGTKSVGIFGSTDPSATGPISNTCAILYNQQDCSPCFKRICPLGTRSCLESITPAQVIAKLSNYFSTKYPLA